ncbi:UNVERIFIED_CONTAM: hypothetical protein Slati_1726500 [Sesamum latifolium]|uniref:CCHC-type domain-containing protein n=1 Tax=Sesamum latifolium TaxID=2727402 RepID=A0AAW2WXE7_9LAMI
MASFIGNKLGKFKDVDLDSSGEIWGSLVCIHVAIDILKPLKRVLKLPIVLGDEHLVTFTYERLPNFCYLCGCLGHLARQCEVQLQEGFIDLGDNTPFGSWLRAAAPLSSRCRINSNVLRDSALVADLNLVPHPPTVSLLPTSYICPPSLDIPTHAHTQSPSPSKDYPPMASSLPLPNQPTLSTDLSIPCPLLKMTTPRPRPRPSSKTATPELTRILSQKRRLVDELFDDEPVTQGPTKSCRLTTPLLDVTNLEAATAGQSRVHHEFAYLELPGSRGALDISVLLQSYSHNHIDVSIQLDDHLDSWCFTGGHLALLGKLGIFVRHWTIVRYRTWALVDHLSLGHCAPNTVREPLDRACANPGWTNLFLEESINHVAMTCSDHAALLLRLQDTHVYGPRAARPWRFEAAWLQSAQCEKVVADT